MTKLGWFDADLAERHAIVYSAEATLLLEKLLVIWPQYSARPGYPYPEIADLMKRGGDFKQQRDELKSALFAFFRRYALFSMGNAGWRRKVWRGYEALGTQDEFCWMLRERQVTMMWVNEAYTSIVRITFIITTIIN